MLQSEEERTLPTPWTEHPFTYWDRTKLLPDYMRGELYPTAMIASPLEQKFSKSRFIDNTKEYVDRYKSPRPEIFKLQLYFLARLAKLCRHNDITLVLVNMPITRKNVALLGEKRYQQFLTTMTEFGEQNDVSFFDLNSFDRYAIEDFHDLVHLNGLGGQKFFSSVGETLSRASGRARIVRTGEKVILDDAGVAVSLPQPH
jgi:hypothetical protein